VKKLAGDIQKLQRDIDDTLKVTKPLEQAVSERRYWMTLMDQIHACLPEELVWITSFDQDLPKDNKEDESGVGQKSTVAAPAAGGKGQLANQTPVRYLIKGFYMENSKGAGVVDAFGEVPQEAKQARLRILGGTGKTQRIGRLTGTKEARKELEAALNAAEASLKEAGLTAATRCLHHRPRGGMD
jgi:hypothetical protein